MPEETNYISLTDKNDVIWFNENHTHTVQGLKNRIAVNHCLKTQTKGLIANNLLSNLKSEIEGQERKGQPFEQIDTTCTIYRRGKILQQNANQGWQKCMIKVTIEIEDIDQPKITTSVSFKPEA